MKRRAFTLIEIMIAAALFGIISVAALAPLVFTVCSLDYAQKSRLAQNRERRLQLQIFAELRTAVSEGNVTAVRIERASGLSLEDDDRLAVFSLYPLKSGRPAAVCVYRVFKEDKLRKVTGGLYRFELALPLEDNLLLPDAQERSPINVDIEKLKPEAGKNIIPAVTGMKIYAFSNGEWSEEYSGAQPEAVKIVLKQGKRETEYMEYFGRGVSDGKTSAAEGTAENSSGTKNGKRGRNNEK